MGIKKQAKQFVKSGVERLKAPDLSFNQLTHLKVTSCPLDGEAANAFISSLMRADRPCMIARFGSTELNAMIAIERIQRLSLSEYIAECCLIHNPNLWRSPALGALQTYSGFFPVKKAYLERFLNIMKSAIERIDLLGSWLEKESKYTQHRIDIPACPLWALEPYFHSDPYSQYLAGARVLVIHPFAHLIEKQYIENRTSLFPGRNVLPEFSLKTISAVQTLAGEKDPRFDTWFDALDWMTEEAIAEDFDIAIIGCGAYGLPLAARLKDYGKKCIHLGGATQILFGIKGRRWDHRAEFSSMYNPHWVRPGDEGKPAEFYIVEGGCYW